jgi:hypothetical protein
MKKVKVVKSMKKEQVVESNDWFGCPDIPGGEVAPISKEGLNSMIDDRRFIVAVQRTEWLKNLTSDEVKAEVVKLYTSLDLDRASKEAEKLQRDWSSAQASLAREKEVTAFQEKQAALETLENVIYDVLFTKASSLVSSLKSLVSNQEFAELLTGDLVSPVFRKTNNGYILNTGTARIAFDLGVSQTNRPTLTRARLISQPRTNSTPTTEYSYESQRIIVNGKEYKWKRTAARKLLKDNTISTKDAIPRLREAGYNVEE